MKRATLHIRLHEAWLQSGALLRGMGLAARIHIFVLVAACMLASSCERNPGLHLPKRAQRTMEIPIVDLELKTYWNYELEYGINYNWEAEWIYGWDSEDQRVFGDTIGYTEPDVFSLRRYYTGDESYGEHTSVLTNTVHGNTFHGEYNWGFWDILVWSDVNPLNDDVQSLNIDETSSLDSVLAYTNQSMRTSLYQAPDYNRAFYQPEQLFSAYDRAVEINENLDGFEFDSIRNVWVKQLDMLLEPVTYIYLTQVILHHNNNKIVGVDGEANFSGMARTTNVNTGVAGNTPIDVAYNVRFKPYVTLSDNCRTYIDVKTPNEVVSVVGGRLLTFGICGQNGNRIKHRSEVRDRVRHYMDVNMQFNNGIDSTFVFDITDKVRDRWRGGVITVELDMDTVPVPNKKGGSAFDAVVKDFEEVEVPEIEM